MKFIVLLKNIVLGVFTISVIFLLFVGYIAEVIEEKWRLLKLKIYSLLWKYKRFKGYNRSN